MDRGGHYKISFVQELYKPSPKRKSKNDRPVKIHGASLTIEKRSGGGSIDTATKFLLKFFF